MHLNNIEQLSAEAQRLLKFTLTCYEELKQKTGMLIKEENGKKQLKFTEKGIEQQIETLSDELTKLTQQEMVLAVVGTMKAGKSTTINAIVGTEVLPNRNRPMTALPTRICHTKGKVEPILYFPHTQPINMLMVELDDALSKASSQHKGDLLLDPEMLELITKIKENIPFETEYVGTDNIFYCLKSLNDLVRLSSELDVVFPFSEYTTVEKIPTIRVEFAHLAALKDGYGQLTLLDTPGPNEAGQSYLGPMLNDQLNKASAVLMIMNYSQINSISDADVRSAVSAVGDNVPIYTLVNRFDEKDRNGDSEEQVKNIVSGRLMKGIVSYENVFPVSAKWGYLANRARHEINVHGKLPAVKEQNWVEDFAEEAIGKRWKMVGLQDNEYVLEAAEALWKDSLFSDPIKKIIQTAYSRAALFSLKSASNKLVSYSNDFYEYITLRDEGLTKDISLLQQNVNVLESDINLLSSIQCSVKEKIDQKISVALSDTVEQTKILTVELIQKTEDYFQKGKLDFEEQERKLIANRKRRSNKTKNKLGFTLSHLISANNQDDSGDRDFDPNLDKIEFKNSTEARSFVVVIQKSIADVLAFGQAKLNTTLVRTLDDLASSLTEEIEDKVSPLEQRIHKLLEEAGFSIQLNFPSFNSSELNFSVEDVFDEAIKREEKTVTRSRRQSGMWGTFCSWFNTDDWGWEEYETTEERYIVRLKEIKSSIHRLLSSLIKNIDIAIKEQIEQPVNQELSNFFVSFTSKLEDVRANLQQSIIIQQKESESLGQIKQDLGFFSRNSKEISSDSVELKKEVSELENEG